MIDNTALLSELYSIQESYSVIEADIDQTSKRCVIDVKERTISVPKEIEYLGVQYDHRSYRLFFEIDRYIHGVDLLTQTCVIQWLSKNGITERSGLHPIVEIEAIDNDKLLFVWELYEDETRIPGVILFAVNFYTMKDENSFLWSYNTLPAQSIIQDTLDVVINPSDEITPSLLMVWNDKMTSIEKLARDSISTSIRSAQEAEAWAHGRADFPNTMLDNAKYYKDLTQALYDKAKDALSEEKDRVVEEAKDEIVNLAKDEVIAVVKNEVTDDVINDVYAAKNDSIAAINDTTTSAIQDVEQSKNNAINDLLATGDQRYAVKGSIPTKVSELENDRNYLTEVPEFPIKSVNGKTGDVDLSAEDVGAVSSEEFTEFKVDYDNHTHTAADVGAATSEEVTQLKSDITKETSERKAEIAVERERINQITRLEEGSTTGDAELIDARIDKDGFTHENVGAHIRTETSHIHDTLYKRTNNLFDISKITKDKYLSVTNGIEQVASQSGYAISNWIDVSGLEKVSFHETNNVVFYNANKEFISNIGNVTSKVTNITYDVPTNAKYMRFTIRNIHDNNMVNSGDSVLPFEPYTLPKIYDNILPKIYGNITNGKRIAFMGDSITWGYNDNVAERVENPYPAIIKQYFGFSECINYGESGSTIGGDGVTKHDGTLNEIGSNPMNLRIDEVDTTVDILVIFGGTNDFGLTNNYVPLGTINDTTNLTFYGSLKVMIDKIIPKFIGKKIFFVTPLHRSKYTTSGRYLSEYVKAIREVCDAYGIEIIDMYANGEFFAQNDYFKQRYSISGLHPNQDWYYILAKKIGNHIVKSIS